MARLATNPRSLTEAAGTLKKDARLRAAVSKIGAGLGGDLRSSPSIWRTITACHHDAHILVDSRSNSFKTSPPTTLREDLKTLTNLLIRRRRPRLNGLWRKEHSVDLLIGQIVSR